MRKCFHRSILLIFAIGLVGCVQSAGANADAQDKEITVILNPERDEAGKIVPVEKTSDEWRAQLSDEEYRILRQHGTERAGTGRFLDNKADGIYGCAGCGLALYDSTTKFNSGTGWPSYYDEIGDGDHITKIEDKSFGMVRIEIRCGRCDGHLGHVFNDGPAPTGLRHCVNGYALGFQARADVASESAEQPAEEVAE